MPSRFLADHCVPTSVVKALREAGHEILKLKECLPVESSDDIVISKAQELHAILLSLNGDFADIVSYPPSRYNGIIALQVRNHPEVIPQVAARLVRYLKLHGEADAVRGRLLVVEPHRIRIRT